MRFFEKKKKNTGTRDSSMKIFNLLHADPIFD